ncbi:hypothetical protein DAEQUDRAFT_359976 [Daedalea quercina L-15889]|uniref:Uncharacterized protein n=1 Tax=Daedalea quercina L-15889 TaxID=1314783 RepID=A0A165TSS7_9APHY|nr:hypothetical protein DAEQUDRAFT_359976 [Daedalea quercina L-15889]
MPMPPTQIESMSVPTIICVANHSYSPVARSTAMKNVNDTQAREGNATKQGRNCGRERRGKMMSSKYEPKSTGIR